MSAFSDYAEIGLLNFTLRGVAFTQPTTIYVALFTADPTDANATANELSDSAYARQDAAQGAGIATGWSAPSIDGIGYAVTNAKALEYAAIADAPVTVSHFGIYDAAIGGNLLYHGALDTSRSLQVGDIVAVGIGSLKITME